MIVWLPLSRYSGNAKPMAVELECFAHNCNLSISEFIFIFLIAEVSTVVFSIVPIIDSEKST